MAQRVFYFCPDFPQPAGGVKALYRHVHVLREAGFEAAIVHQKRGFTLDWHGYQVPTIWLEDRPRFVPEDILVFPEVMAQAVRQTQGFGGRRVVFALSWTPSYTPLKPGERWQDLGVDRVIAQSPTVQRFLHWSMELPVTVIPPYVDPALYYHDPALKQDQFAFMTRKDRSGEWLAAVLTRREGLHGFTWVALQNMDEARYAESLRAARVYVPTTVQEALHVSVLEAMACGCLVVGYSGIGGADYMQGEGEGQNCILVQNGDLLALGRALEYALAELHEAPDSYQPVVENAIATGQQYQDPRREAGGLVAFMESLAR